MRALVLSLAFAALAAPALADGGSSLTLTTPGSAPASTIIDGALWSCAGAVCTAGPGGQEQPVLRACRRVVAQLGAVTAFTWQGAALPADKIAACNAAARR
jgi:hypothetical protein